MKMKTKWTPVYSLENIENALGELSNNRPSEKALEIAYYGLLMHKYHVQESTRLQEEREYQETLEEFKKLG